MAHKEILLHIRERFAKFLTENQHRKTPERFTILETIYSIDDHFDVDSIYKTIKKNGMHMSRATVYNTLELLLQAGLIRKHQFSDKAAFYEKSLYNNQHDHIIVLRPDGSIDRIIEFCDPRIDAIRKDLEQYLNLKIDAHDLYFYVKPQADGSTKS